MSQYTRLMAYGIGLWLSIVFASLAEQTARAASFNAAALCVYVLRRAP